jgi:hypothetical protein
VNDAKHNLHGGILGSQSSGVRQLDNRVLQETQVEVRNSETVMRPRIVRVFYQGRAKIRDVLVYTPVINAVRINNGVLDADDDP